jgi:glycerol-3-phosphate cytidylyltransferase-like family protein
VVDRAELGFETLDIGEVISEIKPDVIALGYDQTDMEKQVRAYVDQHHLSTRIVRIGKFGENTLDSSSKIKQKIIDKLAP